MTLAPTTAAERAAYLRSEIQRHRALYYQEANPEIGDAEFDALVRELSEMEQAFPELTEPDSPTQTVGDDRIEGFPKARHDTTMLSLGNVYSLEDLRAWANRTAAELGVPGHSYFASIKVDGVALELTYQNGELVQAVTRGDGNEGDDVTVNILALGKAQIRPSIAFLKGRFNVRGEVYFTNKAFELANQRRAEIDGKEPFANPRNGAAGTLKLQDSEEVGRRGLAFMAHGVGMITEEIMQRRQQDHYMELLGQAGFAVVPHKVFSSIEELWAWIEEMGKLREELEFPCDGIVVAINDCNKQARLGATGHSPKWAVAYKYPAEQAQTPVKDITVQIGRTGRATPVAELEPVRLAGTMVSRATLHNQDEIERLGQLWIGSTVAIEKGGEIIPKIVRIVKAPAYTLGEPWKMPETCPRCGKPLERRIENDGKGGEKKTASHYCINPKCPAKLIGWLLHWCSRDVMAIKEFGPAVAEALVCQLRVEHPVDLYYLSYSDLIGVGIGEKNAHKLMVEIAGSLNRPFSCTLDGLGIQGIGTSMSRELVKHFASIHDLVNATDEQLLAVPDFGKKTLASFRAWLADDEAQRHLEQLMMANVRMQRTSEETPAAVTEAAQSHPFYGKTLVFTGTLNMTRSDAETMAEAVGAKCSGSVSKKTNLVIAGPNAGSKLGKAQSLGIEVIDEAEFLRRLRNA